MADHPLIGKLQTVRNNFALGLHLVGLFQTMDTELVNKAVTPFVKKGFGVAFATPDKPYEPVENVFRLDLSSLPKQSVREVSLEFGKMLLRNFVGDSFETVKAACITHGKMQEMRDQDWYLFTRLVRNALTHDQRWQFGARDLKKLPTTWRGKTIRADMDGQDVPTSVFSWYESLELWEDMKAFAQTL